MKSHAFARQAFPVPVGRHALAPDLVIEVDFDVVNVHRSARSLVEAFGLVKVETLLCRNVVGVELVDGQIALFVSLGNFGIQNEDENLDLMSKANYSGFCLTAYLAAIDQVEPNDENRWTEMTEAAVAIGGELLNQIWLVKMTAVGAPTLMEKSWYTPPVQRCWMVVECAFLTC